MTNDEINQINVMMNHPCLEAIALVRAAQDNDAEAINRIVEETGDHYAMACWLGEMVIRALDTHDACLNHFLDEIAEATIDMINQHGKWGQQ